MANDVRPTTIVCPACRRAVGIIEDLAADGFTVNYKARVISWDGLRVRRETMVRRERWPGEPIDDPTISDVLAFSCTKCKQGGRLGHAELLGLLRSAVGTGLRIPFHPRGSPKPELLRRHPPPWHDDNR